MWQTHAVCWNARDKEDSLNWPNIHLCCCYCRYYYYGIYHYNAMVKTEIARLWQLLIDIKWPKCVSYTMYYNNTFIHRQNVQQWTNWIVSCGFCWSIYCDALTITVCRVSGESLRRESSYLLTKTLFNESISHHWCVCVCVCVVEWRISTPRRQREFVTKIPDNETLFWIQFKSFSFINSFNRFQRNVIKIFPAIHATKNKINTLEIIRLQIILVENLFFI